MIACKEDTVDLEAMRSLEIRDGVAGKVCAKCGVWKTLASFNKKARFVHSWCKECMKAAYRTTPKNDRRAEYKAYRDANQEKIRSYRLEHKEEFVQYARQYREKNPEKKRTSQRRYNERHPEKKRQANRTWRERFPEKALLRDHRRRARERSAPGIFTSSEWEALKAAYDHMCLACKRREPEIKLVPDHVTPIARGGANDINNIQPLCEICNKRKGARSIDYRDGRDLRVDRG